MCKKEAKFLYFCFYNHNQLNGHILNTRTQHKKMERIASPTDENLVFDLVNIFLCFL